MTTWLVSPLIPTGNNRRIELAGTDLWDWTLVNKVFVYPSKLDIDQLKKSLGRALSLWPIMAGRFLVLDNDHYVIEMSDNPIPVSFVENTDLTVWPLDSKAIVSDPDILLPFLDAVDGKKVADGSRDEPLFRLKLTHLVHSNECVLGASGSHIVGDGDCYARFLNAISRLYQHMEPTGPSPVFERRMWKSDEADQSFLPMMKHLSDSRSVEELRIKFEEDINMCDEVNIHFSIEQLDKLRLLAGGNSVTIQDALIAYLILLLNTHCYANDDQRLILHAITVVNVRGVSDMIAPIGLAANASIIITSDNFNDPFSLSNIAQVIRRSVDRSRDSKFLESYLATADRLMRQLTLDKRCPSLIFFNNGIFVNSHRKCDWANLVDFGYTDKCRLYTGSTAKLCAFITRLNPVYNGSQWVSRDRNGIEVAFYIEKDMKEKFIKAWQQDIDENFDNFKK